MGASPPQQPPETPPAAERQPAAAAPASGEGTGSGPFVIRGPLLGQGAACEAIMRSLPDWFGIEQSIVDYATAAGELPTFVAETAGAVIGFLTLKPTSPCAAEVHVLAVRREAQRRGLGRALLSAAEAYLVERGFEIVHVKTLSESEDYPPYAETRAFYLAMGFRPLEEIRQIWGDENPCLLMVKPLAPSE